MILRPLSVVVLFFALVLPRLFDETEQSMYAFVYFWTWGKGQRGGAQQNFVFTGCLVNPHGTMGTPPPPVSSIDALQRVRIIAQCMHIRFQ